jgi:hypothetical protein
MKADESKPSPVDPAKQDEKSRDNPQPSSSKENNALQDSTETDAQTKDALFEPTVDMLVNDFDEEQTLEEEEALAAKEQVDPSEELAALQNESEMPLEELLKLYGRAPPAFTSSSGSRKRRRRREQTPPSSKTNATETEAAIEATSSSSAAVIDPTSLPSGETAAEDSPDEDGATTTATNTTNFIENQSVDDETNFDDDEPSELKKLYTGIYERDENNGEQRLDAELTDDDDDYIPEEQEEGKKTIMVGLDYQASIPDGMLMYDDALPYENEDKLLWDPSKVKDEDIEDYLAKFASTTNTTVNGGSTIPSSQGKVAKHLRDDEQALLLLLQCGNNFEEALRRRGLGSIVQNNSMSIWSEEECRNFENGLRLYGKSFHEIQASKVRP